MGRGIVGFLLILVVWILVFIPLDLFLLVKYFLEPNGFWQNLVLFGFGAWFLGAIQAMFIFTGIAVTFAIVFAD